MDEQAAQTEHFPAQTKRFAGVVAVLVLVFIVPLWRLVRFAAGDELHSYIILMPAVSLYLAWPGKKKLPQISTPVKVPAAIFFAAGLGVMAWHRHTPHLPVIDGLSQTTLAFLLLLTGAGFWILGGALMRAVSFPFALLVFMCLEGTRGPNRFGPDPKNPTDIEAF